MKSWITAVAIALSLLNVVLAEPVSDQEVIAQFFNPDSKYYVLNTIYCTPMTYQPPIGGIEVLFACHDPDGGINTVIFNCDSD